MNIVFMGTPEFAVPTLQMLIDEGHTISAVVTQPDRPKGRGKKETMSPIKELALKYELPVLQPERVRGDVDFYNHIKTLNPDVIIVVAFGQILPVDVLDIPRLGSINIHGSLLPKYRGASPIQWSIINGDEVTGVTIMYMAQAMDAGDMIYKAEMPIEADDTYQSLHDKMKFVGADALKAAWPLIESGQREQQDDSLATYVSMIHKSLGEIDWSKSTKEIDCLVRGVNPWPGAYTYYDGQVFKVWQVGCVEPYESQQAEAGVILDVNKNGVYVQTQDGVIVLKEIQAPNKKRMPVSEYIKGHTIEVGKKLGN